MEEIIEAAKKAYLHDFVMTLPDVSYAFQLLMTDYLDLQMSSLNMAYISQHEMLFVFFFLKSNVFTTKVGNSTRNNVGINASKLMS